MTAERLAEVRVLLRTVGDAMHDELLAALDAATDMLVRVQLAGGPTPSDLLMVPRSAVLELEAERDLAYAELTAFLEETRDYVEAGIVASGDDGGDLLARIDAALAGKEGA